MKKKSSATIAGAAIIAVLTGWLGLICQGVAQPQIGSQQSYGGASTYAPKNTSKAKTWTALVTYVTDGDTLWVMPTQGAPAVNVRIYGIDAPETCQDYGLAAKAALTQQTLRQSVLVTTKTRDKYGRLVAQISLQGQDVGAWLVANGHAWSNHYRQSLGAYGPQETAARQSRRGLWMHPNPVEPKVFRKKMKCHERR